MVSKKCKGEKCQKWLQKASLKIEVKIEVDKKFKEEIEIKIDPSNFQVVPSKFQGYIHSFDFCTFAIGY